MAVQPEDAYDFQLSLKTKTFEWFFSQKPEECFIKVFQAIRAPTFQYRNVYIYTSISGICHTHTHI